MMDAGYLEIALFDIKSLQFGTHEFLFLSLGASTFSAKSG